MRSVHNPPHAANIALVSSETNDVSDAVGRLVDLATNGLAAMYLPAEREFPQTARGVSGPHGPELRLEGSSLRYTAIAALGLSRTDVEQQRGVLNGITAKDLALLVAQRGSTNQHDPGAVALAAWTAAEVGGQGDERLFAALDRWLSSGQPLPTVDVAWMLTAAIAANALVDTSRIQQLAAERLMAAQGGAGVFPHALPVASLGRLRSHVGCYADQVYPIQALARLSAATGEAAPLEAANRSARRICELQGPQGQWWWHYDVRTGEVIEGYPVYSVHQHAMGPMALLDLLSSGGDDHRDSIAQGLGWLNTHPEVMPELVDDRHQMVWRKVGRREPRKAARKLAAVMTAAKPGARVPLVDRLLPPTKVDYECRPYELGWLLYAWLALTKVAIPDRANNCTAL